MFVSINNLTNQQKISGTTLTKYLVYPLIQGTLVDESQQDQNEPRKESWHGNFKLKAEIPPAHTHTMLRGDFKAVGSVFSSPSHNHGHCPWSIFFPCGHLHPLALRSLFFTFFFLPGFEVSLALRKTSCCSSSWDYHIYRVVFLTGPPKKCARPLGNSDT